MESFRVGVAPDLYVNAGPFSTNSIDSNVGFDLPWNPATIDQLIGNDDGKLHRSEYLSFYSEFDNDLYTNDTDLFYAKYGARFDALQSYAESMCVASAKSVDNFQNMQFCSGLDSRGDVDIKT
ncbi:hypothetical protein KKA47_02830, partial [bacterium]|nr:hypothetical protein [bacterium]